MRTTLVPIAVGFFVHGSAVVEEKDARATHQVEVLRRVRAGRLFCALLSVVCLADPCLAEVPTRVKDIRPGPNGSMPGDLVDVNGTLFFVAAPVGGERNLMKTDGTAAGTVVVSENPRSPFELLNVNGTLFMRAYDNLSDLELWKSDGSDAGSVRVKDIWSGPASSNPALLTDVNGTLYFTAEDPNDNRELWKSDGSPVGTVQVRDIEPGGDESYISELTNVAGTLFFAAITGPNDNELWKSNGTTEGTVQVKDIHPGDVAAANPNNLVDVNGTLFFAAFDGGQCVPGQHGSELWKSDGTNAGTVLVEDINVGCSDSSPEALTNVNGRLFFSADDGVSGRELWVSIDGTAAGTSSVKDINSGPASSDPQNLTNVNGLLYFSADDGISGRELYRSDGGFINTTRLKDIAPGAAGSNPSSVTVVNGRLVFTADDGVHGRELWTTDGTPGGTMLLADIAPGVAGSDPQSLTVSGGSLYFSADEGVSGRELWTIPAFFTEAASSSGTADTRRSIAVAWGDYDGDGDLDLFVPNYTAENRLYRNNGNGTFTDVAVATGVNDGSHSQSAAWGDYDNDGDLDLYVTRDVNEANRLFRNDGSGFTDVGPASGTADTRPSLGAAWADYNRDGDLDLFVANNNAENRLYRNNGDGTFSDVAAATGVNDGGLSVSPAWGDYDNDGDLDLYVTRGVNESNRLFRNDGGVFNDVGSASGTGDTRNSVGAAWGDYDNDGDLDLFVANWMAENRLYRNQGAGTFIDVAVAMGVNDGGASRCPAWGDYDNDGDLDLYVTHWVNETDRLFRNDGSGFTDVGPASGTSDIHPSVGAAWADYDQDGDLDLYVANDAQPNKLYRNNAVGPLNHWLQVRLVGVQSNRAGIGARVRIKRGGVSQIREIQGGSYLSQNSLAAEFGLGISTVVDSLVIHWPSGIVWHTTGVAADQRLTVVETMNASDVEGPPKRYMLSVAAYPNPFNPATTIRYTLPARGRVKIAMHDARGLRVATLLEMDQEAGGHAVPWNGRNDAGRVVTSGVYFARLEFGDERRAYKTILLK